jgi:tetratricopeptide (TPR) repeat protein
MHPLSGLEPDRARHAAPRSLAAALAILAAMVVVAAGTFAGAAARPWVEVKSPHFTVISDAGDKSARRVAWQFEQVRAVLLRLWPWAHVSAGKPVMVFAARDEATLKTLAPKFWEQKGGMRPSSVFVTGRDRHYVALRTDTAEPDSVEANPYFQTYWSYVYLVLQASFEKELPPWYGRGLADFFANTIVRDKDVQVGRIVPWHLRELRQTAMLPLSTLFSVDRQSPYLTHEGDSRVFDASAWALVHYLTLGERGANLSKFNRFSTAMRASRDPVAALREVYGDLAALEGEVRSYAERTLFAYQLIGIDVDVSPEGFALRPLQTPESAAARAALHAAMGRPVEARALVDAAKKADPTLSSVYETDGLVYDIEGRKDEALAAYSKAVELGAGNFYAYYRHAQLSWRQSADALTLRAIEKSLERAIALNADYAATHSFLADIKVGLGEAAAAEPLARRAVSLEPTASYHHASLAWVLMRVSKKDEAVREAQAALSLARNETERQRAQSLLDRLKREPPR